MTAAPGITTSGQPPTAVVQVQPGMNVQPVVLVDHNGQYVSSGGFANPMTTEGDLIYENATPAPARLAIGSAGQVLGVSSGVPAWGMGMTLLATTGTTAYTLVNGTGNIITWTAPNDGALHRVFAVVTEHVATTLTGGVIILSFTAPDGTAGASNILVTGQSPGVKTSVAVSQLVQANTVVAIQQNTAITGGAATLWAEIWGS